MFGLRERGPQGRMIVLACTLLAASACGPKDEEGGQGTFVPPATTAPDTGTVTTAPEASTTPPAGGNDAGSPVVKPAMDSGTTVAVVDAGTTSPAADTGTADAGGDGGSVASGPKPLPGPEVMGPYVVKELDNVGKGFENPIDSGDVAGNESGCALFISLFTSDQMEIDSYSKVPPEYKMDLYTLFYPEGAAPGQKFPVLSWANGTCAHTVGYAEMIKYIVSHGFIVIATHSRATGSGSAQKRGIDWVLTQDTAMDSPLFGHVNKDQVGVFGHSQGGGSTGIASGDARVKTSVLMHGGNGNMLHAPAFFLTGEMDNPTGVRSNYDASRQPAAFGNLKMSNHITMMKEYMRMAPEVAAWFRYQLLQDEVAKKWFVGTDCVLCKDPEWVYAQKNLK